MESRSVKHNCKHCARIAVRAVWCSDVYHVCSSRRCIISLTLILILMAGWPPVPDFVRWVCCVAAVEIGLYWYCACVLWTRACDAAVKFSYENYSFRNSTARLSIRMSAGGRKLKLRPACVRPLVQSLSMESIRGKSTPNWRKYRFEPRINTDII